MRIAIVNSSSFGRYFPEHIERLARLGEVQRVEVPASIGGADLARALQGFPILIVSVTPRFSPEFFAHKDETWLIARHGIGVDNIHLPSATACGVLVTRVPGPAERDAVAEATVALMLAVLRLIPQAVAAVREGQWAQRAAFVGHELRGKTVGLVGFGNIGSRVGEILARGFGARVLAYDPEVPPEAIRAAGAEPASLETLLEKADILSLHAALTERNYHLLSHEAFARMKPGVVLVNTARGELIDEDALIAALESGRVAGAALDVVEGEPIGPDHPLLRFPNVLVVPHIAAYTWETLRRMGEKMVADVERVLRGEVPEEVVNPEVIPHARALRLGERR
ncbi:MAG: D-isomer specific 2-hydroxyacid dehydrogenase family protein [Anaerolineae bacterium]|nr:D-isomer specific 2-hydroxyacid dehydrogenase family protein [Anaerolineae bacterium]MCX8068295.1 D-isomer specific 2-hydroxyacid dehydrogenase family protein [Anaerolineae bacterium]MDW7992030.1 D-isomer specific 2-hydroxyacid dehydrogenase family protein [Anaerolineae bacterium]